MRTEPESRPRYLRVALDLPASQLGAAWFDYAIAPEQHAIASGGQEAIVPGSWVLVPWGRGRKVGLVLELAEETELEPARIRQIIGPLSGAPRAPLAWLKLLLFAANYYHRGLGEIALPAVPRLLRTPPAPGARGSAFDRARARFGSRGPDAVPTAQPAPELNPAQRQALAALQASSGFAVNLLHGVTGSGKTEVYLRWLSTVLAADPACQVLLLVPEIALTPQLAAQVAARFPGETLAILHSELPDAERCAHWLAVAEGRARVVIGTRLAVLAPMPKLAAIVVDEEHDPSYKQQEGVRYSARDLAIVAGSQRGLPVLLGSATPSLETWLAVRRDRYRLLRLPGRVGDAALPAMEVLDLRQQTLRHDLAPRAVSAIGEAMDRGEQVLVFINRRGYAPVLACDQCGWLSRCADCSAYRVLHRAAGGLRGVPRYRLVCHHCGAEQAVPRVCPDCGNLDLRGLGQGTQRLEEGLAELFPGARIARLDRDVASRRGAAKRVLDAAHAGEVDILVGTQMLAKGHDFRRLSLVVAVDCDGGLYSADYRAPERLFATLMQVAGRAGRDARASRVLLQTRFPGHPLFAYLTRYDYDGFADLQLAERREAGLPPWRCQALLRAEASTRTAALEFLSRARQAALDLLAINDAGDFSATGSPSSGHATRARAAVAILDPVPMAMSRLAGRERAQLLVESDTRPPLHRFLEAWLARLRELPGNVRWALDVDPAEI